MPYGFAEFLRTTLLIFGALFPIVNPLGNTPIFLALTRGFPSETRAILARKVAVNGFFLLVASMLIGTYILAFFGISVPVVQVGGGMVVIATAWSLLQKADTEEARSDRESSLSRAEIARRAFYPLTLPLTVGPGSISVAITVGAGRSAGSESPWTLLAAVVGPALIGVTIYLSYRFAERIGAALGETAMSVILRLASFILLCI